MPSAGLRAYYAWLPVLPTDTRGAANRAASTFAEPRAMHFWDERLDFARHIAAALGITSAQASVGVTVDAAWDVYLAYSPGRRAIDQPDFWMHQLNLQHAPRLDAAIWRLRVEELGKGGV